MSEVSSSPVSKVRLRFAKTDDLRFLSHHDVMRLLERLCRRAELPLRSTEGFNPKAKITFASALGLGIEGHEEVVEIDLDGEFTPAAIIEKLTPLIPEGFRFLRGSTVVPNKTAQPVRAIYHLPLPAEFRPELAAHLQELLKQRSVSITRIRTSLQSPADAEPAGEERLDALTSAPPLVEKREVKKLEIRPLINNLWRDAQGYWMDVAITNQGAIRPEELLRLVDLEDYWLDGHSILQRTKLVVEDEQPVETSVDRLRQRLAQAKAQLLVSA
jgi:radical SAM-linked protein